MPRHDAVPVSFQSEAVPVFERAVGSLQPVEESLGLYINAESFEALSRSLYDVILARTPPAEQQAIINNLPEDGFVAIMAQALYAHVESARSQAGDADVSTRYMLPSSFKILPDAIVRVLETIGIYTEPHGLHLYPILLRNGAAHAPDRPAGVPADTPGAFRPAISIQGIYGRMNGADDAGRRVAVIDALNPTHVSANAININDIVAGKGSELRYSPSLFRRYERFLAQVSTYVDIYPMPTRKPHDRDQRKAWTLGFYTANGANGHIIADPNDTEVDRSLALLGRFTHHQTGMAQTPAIGCRRHRDISITGVEHIVRAFLETTVKERTY